jgi:hypothetical protein
VGGNVQGRLRGRAHSARQEEKNGASGRKGKGGGLDVGGELKFISKRKTMQSRLIKQETLNEGGEVHLKGILQDDWDQGCLIGHAGIKGGRNHRVRGGGERVEAGRGSSRVRLRRQSG